LQPVNPGPNGYFEANLAPGGRQTFSVVVKNLGDTTATYRVYPADGTTSAVTGVQYSESSPPPTKAGSWITIATPQVTLAGGSNQTVSFSVSVPAGAIPGDHVAAVASDSPTSGRAQGGAGNGSSGNVALSVTARVIVAVVIHVPGPGQVALQVGQPSFGIESGGRQTLIIPLNDTGDLLFKPHLSGAVTPCRTTNPLIVIDRQLDTFVPHTSINYAYHIQNTTLPLGCYTVDLQTDYPSGSLGSFHGNLQLGAAATTFVPPGGPRTTGPSHGRGHHSTSAAVIALGAVASLLCLGVLVLLLLLLWRRSKEDEDETTDGSGQQNRPLVPSR
jgi:hypothetical protein